MSQSSLHCQLVVAAANAIEKRDPSLEITKDILTKPGDPVPWLIGGYRPDIIGRSGTKFARIVIAEAKTNDDILREHTHNQVEAFLKYLESIPCGIGTFILAVNGEVADIARRFLIFVCLQRVTDRLRVELYDGLDFWILNSYGSPLWRLY